MERDAKEAGREGKLALERLRAPRAAFTKVSSDHHTEELVADYAKSETAARASIATAAADAFRRQTGESGQRGFGKATTASSFNRLFFTRNLSGFRPSPAKTWLQFALASAIASDTEPAFDISRSISSKSRIHSMIYMKLRPRVEASSANITLFLRIVSSGFKTAREGESFRRIPQFRRAIGQRAELALDLQNWRGQGESGQIR